MPLIRVIDFETTGDQPDSKIVEVGWTDIDIEEMTISPTVVHLVNPGIPIPYEVVGVHHIRDQDVEKAETWAEVSTRLLEDENVVMFAAHHCAFELVYMPEEQLGGRPMLCTMKAAMRLWPNAANFKNQTLRYMLNLDLDPALAMPPHRAGPDSYVTAHILLQEMELVPLTHIRNWTREPAQWPRIMFGKHGGSEWRDVPLDYLEWMMKQNDMDADAKWCADREMKARKSRVRNSYVRECFTEIAGCTSRDSLQLWFKREADRRAELGIVKDTEEYRAIVRNCQERAADLETAQN